MLFHHFVSVLGLSHGVRFPSEKVVVAAFGVIEIHTSFMTFRRFTGLRSPWFELFFQVVTVLIRLLFIPGLVVASVKSLYDLGILLSLDGLPPLAAVGGLSFFNACFLAKRKHMFNFRPPPPT